MATFNGWEIIPMPTAPAAPATIDFTAIDTVALSVSPFTGQQQVQNWQASWFEASVSMPALSQLQAPEWIAFLMALEGVAHVFQLGDPLGVTPRGSAAGVPVVDGASQGGRLLNTRGWTPNASGVLLRGDWLQIGYRLYRTISPLDVDADGKGVIRFWPNLREPPPDGQTIITTGTKGLWRLKSNSRGWSITQSRTYGMQFDIREAF